jgi:hypothetical protein
MNKIQLRDISEARGATTTDTASSEPSHIHIPRPSRVRQSIDRRRDDGDSSPAQLDLESAAA